MKKLLALLVMVSASAIAGPTDPNQLRLTQNNTNVPSNGTLTRFIPMPADGSSCIIELNGSTLLPDCATAGTGLALSGGVLSATAAQADWNAGSGAAQILNKPSFASVATSGAYADISGTPSLATVATSGAYADLSGKPSLATVATSGSYNDLTNKPTINSGTVTSVAAGAGLSGGTITTSGTISMPNTGTSGTYSGVTTDAQGRVTAGTNRGFSYSARSLNACFQVSASRDALVTYSVDIATVSTLVGGQVGTVYMEVFTDSGCTTGTQEVGRFVNGNTQSLGLSVTMNQNVTANLGGVVASGMYVKLRTQNNTGSPTFTYRSTQEVLL